MRISVIMPCHNAAEYVGDAIRSIGAQTYAPHEVIVINDASTDNSAEVIKSCGVDVQLLETEYRNAAAARNAGIEIATGDWIAYLDSDDAWYPSHLQRAVDILGPSDAVACKTHFDMLRDGETIHWDTPWPCQEPRADLTHMQFIEWFTRWTYFNNCGVLMRKDICDEVGRYDVDQKRRHDFELLMRVIHNHHWAYNPEPQMCIRMDTPGSISRNRPNCAYYFARALINNEQAYAGPAMSKALAFRVKAVMTTAYLLGDRNDRRLAWELVGDRLSTKHRCLFRAMSICPWPFRAAINLRRRLFFNQTPETLGTR